MRRFRPFTSAFQREARHRSSGVRLTHAPGAAPMWCPARGRAAVSASRICSALKPELIQIKSFKPGGFMIARSHAFTNSPPTRETMAQNIILVPVI